MKNKKGFSLIEAMIAVSILFVIIVSVLAAFATQIKSDRQTDEKNIALALAESRMEEFIKMPASQINTLVQPVTDYYVQDTHRRFVPFGVPGDIPPLTADKVMQRQVTWIWNGIMLDLNVVVNYFNPARENNQVFMFRVNLTATRGEA